MCCVSSSVLRAPAGSSSIARSTIQACVVSPAAWAVGATMARASPARASRRRMYRERPGAPKLAGRSQPELLASDAGDLFAVGAAAGLLHHVPDDDADRLHVARTQLVG